MFYEKWTFWGWRAVICVRFSVTINLFVIWIWLAYGETNHINHILLSEVKLNWYIVYDIDKLFINSNVGTVGDWEWISNSIQHFIGHVIIYSRWGQSWTILVKGSIGRGWWWRHDEYISRSTGSLWAESQSHPWFPQQNAIDSGFWCFLYFCREYDFELTVKLPVSSGTVALMWCPCNVYYILDLCMQESPYSPKAFFLA